MLYNEERKLRFTKENNNFKDGEIFEKRMNVLFSHTEKMETRLQKDICDFSYNEIIDFYKIIATASYDRLVVMHNALETYCAWCLKNGYVADGLNHYSEVSSDAIGSCVNLGKQKELFIARADLLKIIAGFSNAYEQVIILGLYEGLTLEDMQELRMKHVDTKKGVVNIPKGRSLSVSKELIHYMEESADTFDRYGPEGHKTNAVNLDLGDDRIIKSFRKKTQTDNRITQFFGIMKRIKVYYGYPWTSAAILPQIGAANMLLELWKKENEKDVADVAAEHLEEIKYRYGMNWKYGQRFQLKYGFIFE